MGGDREPLTRRRIAEAAVELLDEVGEEGFTMRRLAGALGVDPMALYHHLPGKAAVVHEAIEVVVSQCELPEASEPWQDRVRGICRALRRLAARHPGVFPLLCAHQDFVPSDFAVQEALLAAVARSGLSDVQVVRAASALLSYAAGFALDELTGTVRPFSEEERATLMALQHGAFPTTARLVDAMLDCDLDAEFEFGLELMLTGIAAFARSAPD